MVAEMRMKFAPDDYSQPVAANEAGKTRTNAGRVFLGAYNAAVPLAPSKLKISRRDREASYPAFITGPLGPAVTSRADVVQPLNRV